MISSNFSLVELDTGLLAGMSDPERGLVALGERFFAALRLKKQVVQDFRVIEGVRGLAGLNAKLFGKIHHNGFVPENSPQPVVAAGADHADQPIFDLDHRDVKRAAPQVINEDRLVLTLLETVGDGGRGGFVQDRANVQARQAAGIGCRLAFRRTEIRGAGDHDIGDLCRRAAISASPTTLRQINDEMSSGPKACPSYSKTKFGSPMPQLDP